MLRCSYKISLRCCTCCHYVCCIRCWPPSTDNTLALWPHCLPLHLLLILVAAATPAAGVARIVTCPSAVWPGDAVHSAAKDQIVPTVSWHQTRTPRQGVYASSVCLFCMRNYYYY